MSRHTGNDFYVSTHGEHSQEPTTMITIDDFGARSIIHYVLYC
jgi:hypothetical protein